MHRNDRRRSQAGRSSAPHRKRAGYRYLTGNGGILLARYGFKRPYARVDRVRPAGRSKPSAGQCADTLFALYRFSERAGLYARAGGRRTGIP
jgi:hypothetical protein